VIVHAAAVQDPHGVCVGFAAEPVVDEDDVEVELASIFRLELLTMSTFFGPSMTGVIPGPIEETLVALVPQGSFMYQCKDCGADAL
jgi:hypothetical protein